jgi:hypothetical protein
MEPGERGRGISNQNCNYKLQAQIENTYFKDRLKV